MQTYYRNNTNWEPIEMKFPIIPLIILLGSIMVLPTRSTMTDVSPAQIQGLAVTLAADASGWNYSITNPASVNPLISSARLFIGQPFTATVKWENLIHNLAIYAPGTPITAVNPLQPCNTTPGCITQSLDVDTSFRETTLTYTFASFGLYEYYCEYHPDTMHGQVRVLKSLDISGDGSINIIDLARVGAAFGSTPASTAWDPDADLNFDNVINIIDLAVVAANFGRTL